MLFNCLIILGSRSVWINVNIPSALTEQLILILQYRKLIEVIDVTEEDQEDEEDEGEGEEGNIAIKEGLSVKFDVYIVYDKFNFFLVIECTHWGFLGVRYQ